MDLQKEYAGILYFAGLCKDLCKILEYDYLNRDDDIQVFLDEKMEFYSKYLSNKGINKSSDALKDYMEHAWVAASWFKYKKIYRFDTSFVDYLQDTDVGPVYAELLKRLPYNSFYISFPKRDMINPWPVVPDDINELEGMFVRIKIVDDLIRVGMVFQKTGKNITDYKDKCAACHITTIKDGSTLKGSLDWTLLPEERQKAMEAVGIKEAYAYWYPLYCIAINACQYLCASNAEIQDVKVKKKNRPTVMTMNGPKPVNVQVSDVGFKIGRRFEEMYGVKDDSETDISVDTISGVHRRGYKMRPHVRRAHWHHYWTGKGRTDLEVRWVEPVFVMSDLGKEPEIAVIHDAKGDKS